MMMRSLRLLTAAAAMLALALPAAGLAGPSAKGADRGVVQSVETTQIVLRTLDGGIVSFAVPPGTPVRLNGARASLADIKPGFVARVVHDRSGRATLVQAFGGPVTTTDRGVVTAVTKHAITLRVAGGSTITFAMDSSTRFRLLGVAAPRRLVRPGAQVAVTHGSGAPATVVNVLKRAGA